MKQNYSVLMRKFCILQYNKARGGLWHQLLRSIDRLKRDRMKMPTSKVFLDTFRPFLRSTQYYRDFTDGQYCLFKIVTVLFL